MRYLKKIIAVTSLLVLASSVQAADRANYNGNVCKSYYGYNAKYIHSLYNGTYNNSSSTKYVSCPIVSDAVANTTGIDSTYIYYRGTGEIKCALKSLNYDGTVDQTRLGSRVNTGWIKIPSLSSESSPGSLTLYCQLPAKGLLVNIALSEND